MRILATGFILALTSILLAAYDADISHAFFCSICLLLSLAILFDDLDDGDDDD